MSDNILVEVQMDIVRRLPGKRILQCRSVSKSWKARIDTLHFTARCGVSPANTSTLVYAIVKELPTNFSYFDLKPIGYSHGVLCFSYGPIVSDYMGFVWNLSIRRSCGTFVPYFTQSEEYEKRLLAIGVRPHNHDPIILKISYPFNPQQHQWSVLLFTFSSREWNHLQTEFFPRQSIRLKKASQCVVASFQCMLNIPTPCQLKLIGFDGNNDPILEVQNPEGWVTTLGVYKIAFGTFHNLGIEGDAGSFFISPYCESIILQTHVDRMAYGLVNQILWWFLIMMVIYAGLPIVLEQAKVFEKKCIDREKYGITFKDARNIPAQGGLFGDCGIWVCIFLYRLSHGKRFAVENPVQAALAYREHMANFFFKHWESSWYADSKIAGENPFLLLEEEVLNNLPCIQIAGIILAGHTDNACSNFS
ncbi:F-box domain-containing protein [Artemisia annua]|uniref:F-box domain-containing protein n=1 Tax=Artemisia annua TaxID=35608 RepID=A0A2U1P6T3_ARTAN|nr:F-box domain-containing protein [Artemisia annua]